MLSSLPKLADKAFIVGFFLPTLLFVFAMLGLFYDVPQAKAVLETIPDGPKLEKLVTFVLVVWALAVFLVLTNNQQYKILEGYVGPFTKSACFRNRELKRFDALDARVRELRGKLASGRLPPEEESELQDKWVELRKCFAEDRSILLPTRFGNAILAFEQYANKVYDADSVTLWSHLATVVSKDFQGALEYSRAQVDGLVNICFLALVTALAAAGRIVWEFCLVARTTKPVEMQDLLNDRNVFFAACVVVALIVARASYKLAIQRAYAWGDNVKAAFDCYLPDLAKKLGLKLPPGRAEQNELWAAVSARASLHHPFETATWAQPPEESAKSPAASSTEKTDPGKPGGKDEREHDQNAGDGEPHDTDQSLEDPDPAR